MKKTLLLTILFVIISLFQASFLGNFDFPLLQFDCVLVGLLMLLGVLPFQKLSILAITCGLVADIFSGLPFGVFLLAYPLALVAMEAVFLNFLTNNSFYSLLIMVLVGTVVFNLFFLGAGSLAYSLSLGEFPLSAQYWSGLGWQLVSNALLLVICFLFINRRSKLFKPAFLRS